MSHWVDHVIWWHVYPLGFVGAEDELAGAHPEPHRLRRLVDWLDHLVSLGCNGLALGPIFTSSTHGYDTVDYFQIDPRLGDDADFDALVAACRERGIRVLLDGVFNHVGREFPRFAEALESGVGSDAASWFHLYDNGDDPITANYFEGHDQLIELNHGSVEVQDHVAAALNHWLDRGIDGWRLDAAYAVDPAFWAAIVPGVREQHPDAWFVGEMIHGEYADYIAKSTLDSVTAYELWKATWSSLNDVNLHELSWTVGRHAALIEDFVPMTFLGNHDVTRVASQIADPRHLAHAIAILGFMPGIPSIYYGDEFGLAAIKEERVGGDDAIRPEMPAERGLYRAEHPEIEELYRRVIGVRRRHPWLVDAQVSAGEASDEQLVITARPRHEDHPGLLLALNLHDHPVDLPGGAGELVEASAPYEKGQIPAHAWAIVDERA
ncbi:MAG TPA: alpha-amylase family glycosyl hydrolase [Propionibacteriaceae bacterium]